MSLGTGCRRSEEPAEPAPKPKPEAPRPAPKPPEKALVSPRAPLGLPAVPIPADNPMTAEKIELGKMLYFDTRLSKDNKISCATCHDPEMAWTDYLATSIGIRKQVGERNAPTVINAAYMTSQFWDGREPTLEAQALGPIENPIEMGHTLDVLVKELAKIPGYANRFNAVFGTGVTKEGIAKAIAAFERTVLSGNSPYDRFKAGDAKALTDAQKRGMALFAGKATCATCHTPPIFSNGQFYNTGVGADKKKPDEGRKMVTGKDGDRGKFRVPHLREVAKTHPYFHDGSVKTLQEAVELMAGGGRDNPNVSPIMKGLRAAKLTAAEKKDLVAFLKALSGEYPKIAPPKLP